MSARTWPKTGDRQQQANTLAGLHADYIMFVLDESGAMPEGIMASAEAALSSCVEGHIVQAGNPTHLTGPLYNACVRDRRQWKVIEINGDPDNPNRAKRVDIEWARIQIERYGRDNPWVLINVFGQFPPASLNALIGRQEVDEAAARYYRLDEIGHAPKIIGVDVARFGDDSSAICKRHGIQTFPLVVHKNIDSIQGAGLVAREAKQIDADAIFIDDTGGFGSGWVDNLRRLGFSPIGVHFNSAAHNKSRYYNKRTEMYFETVDWIKRGGAIPDDKELKDALVATTYTFKGDRMIIEPKDMIKARLGFSPDTLDSLILTHAELIQPKQQLRQIVRRQVEYDPIRAFDAEIAHITGRTDDGYDPFR